MWHLIGDQDGASAGQTAEDGRDAGFTPDRTILQPYFDPEEEEAWPREEGWFGILLRLPATWIR